MNWSEEAISDLFYGALYPKEDLGQLAAQQEAELLQNEILALGRALPQKTADELDAHMEALESARITCCEKAFEAGFRIGVKLLLDTLK